MVNITEILSVLFTVYILGFALAFAITSLIGNYYWFSLLFYLRFHKKYSFAKVIRFAFNMKFFKLKIDVSQYKDEKIRLLLTKSHKYIKYCLGSWLILFVSILLILVISLAWFGILKLYVYLLSN